MSNKVRFGLSNLHVAFYNSNTNTYETPIPVPGVVGFKPSAEGDAVEFYADNIKYYNATNNNGYTADLESALIPDSIITRMQNWYIDSNGGVLERSDTEQSEFALLFQVDGDVRNRRHVYYSCKAARPTAENKTTEKSKEPVTETLPITITPKSIGSYIGVKYTLELNDTNAAIYNSFFDAVVLPDATPAIVTKVELAKVIAIAGKLDEADYTEGSWTAFEAVLTASTAVNSNGSATQQQVNTATSNLQNAILDLVTV